MHRLPDPVVEGWERVRRWHDPENLPEERMDALVIGHRLVEPGVAAGAPYPNIVVPVKNRRPEDIAAA